MGYGQNARGDRTPVRKVDGLQSTVYSFDRWLSTVDCGL